MEKIIERNLLYDFYGQLLNEHQRRIYEDAAYGDLSLSELADTYEVSRQGVHDLLKRCDKQLLEYEERLKLIERFMAIKDLSGQINRLCDTDSDKDIKIKALSEEILNIL